MCGIVHGKRICLALIRALKASYLRGMGMGLPKISLSRPQRVAV